MIAPAGGRSQEIVDRTMTWFTNADLLAKFAREAITGEKTLARLAGVFGVHLSF